MAKAQVLPENFQTPAKRSRPKRPSAPIKKRLIKREITPDVKLPGIPLDFNKSRIIHRIDEEFECQFQKKDGTRGCGKGFTSAKETASHYFAGKCAALKFHEENHMSKRNLRFYRKMMNGVELVNPCFGHGHVRANLIADAIAAHSDQVVYLMGSGLQSDVWVKDSADKRLRNQVWDLNGLGAGFSERYGFTEDTPLTTMLTTLLKAKAIVFDSHNITYMGTDKESAHLSIIVMDVENRKISEICSNGGGRHNDAMHRMVMLNKAVAMLPDHEFLEIKVKWEETFGDAAKKVSDAQRVNVQGNWDDFTFASACGLFASAALFYVLMVIRTEKLGFAIREAVRFQDRIYREFDYARNRKKKVAVIERLMFASAGSIFYCKASHMFNRLKAKRTVDFSTPYPKTSKRIFTLRQMQKCDNV